jgi:LCP family protein required for cell wall assembly
MADNYDSDFWYDVSQPKKRIKRKKGIPWIPTIIMLIVVFSIFTYGGYRFAEWWLNKSYASGGEKLPSEEILPDDKRLNVLLLGVDQRGNEPARSDTIIVAFLDLKKPDVKLLSIPRDTRVDIPGRGKQKLNHSHAFGGPELTAEVVSDLLGVEIDKYVEVNFENFEKIIDTLGGIEMNVEKRMLYKAEGIDLQPGLQRLNGHDALGYVRYRSDGDDTTRIKRQQKFLKELAEETIKLSTVWKLPKLVSEVNESVKTNLSTKEMLALANVMRKTDTSAIEGTMLPGTPEYIGGISYWLADEEEVKKLVDIYTGKVQPNPETSESTTSDAGNQL